jgi:hypothetical protein
LKIPGTKVLGDGTPFEIEFVGEGKVVDGVYVAIITHSSLSDPTGYGLSGQTSDVRIITINPALTLAQVRAQVAVHVFGNDGDPSTYPDAILRKQAGYDGGTGGSAKPSSGSGTRPGGSEGADERREGAAPPKPDSWADRNKGPVWESKGRGGDSAADKAPTKSSGDHSSTVTGKTTSQTTYESGGKTHTATHVTKGGGGGADSGKAANPKPDRTATEGRRPVLLDLDGNGVKIAEYQNSTQFMTGKDGFQHRSSWAGAGDGVLFYDPDGRNAITEHRQYDGGGGSGGAPLDLGHERRWQAECGGRGVREVQGDGDERRWIDHRDDAGSAGDHRDQPDGQYGEHRASRRVGHHRADHFHAVERDGGDGGEHDPHRGCGGVPGGRDRGDQLRG